MVYVPQRQTINAAGGGVKPAPSVMRGDCAFPRLVIYRFDQRINGFYFADGVLLLHEPLTASNPQRDVVFV